MILRKSGDSGKRDRDGSKTLGRCVLGLLSMEMLLYQWSNYRFKTTFVEIGNKIK